MSCSCEEKTAAHASKACCSSCAEKGGGSCCGGKGSPALPPDDPFQEPEPGFFDDEPLSSGLLPTPVNGFDDGPADRCMCCCCPACKEPKPPPETPDPFDAQELDLLYDENPFAAGTVDKPLPGTGFEDGPADRCMCCCCPSCKDPKPPPQTPDPSTPPSTGSGSGETLGPPTSGGSPAGQESLAPLVPGSGPGVATGGLPAGVVGDFTREPWGSYGVQCRTSMACGGATCRSIGCWQDMTTCQTGLGPAPNTGFSGGPWFECMGIDKFRVVYHRGHPLENAPWEQRTSTWVDPIQPESVRPGLSSPAVPQEESDISALASWLMRVAPEAFTILPPDDPNLTLS